MSSITGIGERLQKVLGQIGSNLWLSWQQSYHGNRKPPLTYNGENDVSTFSRLLLIRSVSYLQATRTCLKSRRSSNFGQIGPLTTELAALKSKKFSILIMGKCCLHASSFIFNRIIIKVAGNQDRHKSSNEFDFGPDQTTNFGVTCPWSAGHMSNVTCMWLQHVPVKLQLFRLLKNKKLYEPHHAKMCLWGFLTR